MFAFPNMNHSFNMYTALVDQFHRNGYDVTVLAPDPNIVKTTIRVEKGIEVLRVQTLPIKNVSNFIKGISNVLLPIQYWFALKKNYSNKSFDAVIMPTPPITLGGLAHRIKKKYNAKLYLILRDIFPQNAVDLKFIKKNGLIHRFFSAREAKLYQCADAIGCMSQASINYIKKHHPIADEKLHILRNWQYKYRGNPSAKDLISKYCLDGKFVAVFGGNMGKPQQLENILELAKRCKKYDNILFLLLGDGVAMNSLKDTIIKGQLTNIRIQGTIPKNEYQDLLSVCDIGLISLHKDFTIPNIPSKALDYFNVGIPILASLDTATDFNQILDNSKSGLWSIAGDHNSFFSNFLKLYKNKDLRSAMGANGITYFDQYLLPRQAYQIVESKIAF
jgi:glycosyltransferase involved in cell wall biosynthesis